MASYYVNNSVGNDSNAGTSPGAGNAWATLGKVLGFTFAAGDVVYFTYTGVDYTHVLTAAATFAQDVDFMIDPAQSANPLSQYPIWDVTRTVNTYTLTFTGSSYWYKINRLSQETTGSSSTIRLVGAAGKSISFNSCKLHHTNTITGTSVSTAQYSGNSSSGHLSFKNCDIELAGNYVFSPSASSGNLIGCKIWGMNNESTSATITATLDITRCIFDMTWGGTSTSQRRSCVSISTGRFVNNDIIARHTSGNFNIFGAAGGATDQAAAAFDNIGIVLTKNVAYTVCGLGGTSSAIAANANPTWSVGNNLFVGVDAALTAENVTAGTTTYWPDIVSATNPFISTTIGNADYAKLDPTNGTAAKGTSIFTNVDLGVYQSAGGTGETDGSYIIVGAPSGLGTVPQNKVLADQTHGTLPLAAVKATNGGTLSLNDILTTAGGNFVAVTDASKYELGTVFGISGVGTSVGAPFNDLITASILKKGQVKKNLNVNVTGTDDGSDFNDLITGNDLAAGKSKLNRDVLVTSTRTEANPINVRTGTPTYGASGTEFTPSNSPDFASPANVTENDTTDGVAGQIPLNKVVQGTSAGTLPQSKVLDNAGGTLDSDEVLTTSGGNYVAADASKYQDGEDFGVNETGTYDPITGNWEPVSATDLRKDVVKKQNGSTVTGLLDVDAEANLPDPADVDEDADPFGSELQFIPSLNVDDASNSPDTADVEIGAPNYGKNLDKVPTGVGARTNDVVDPAKYANGEIIKNRNINVTGTLTGSGVDPKYILFPFGDLGKINVNNLDISLQIRNHFLTVLEANMADYMPLDHLENLPKNNYRQNAKRYGIRVLDLAPVNGTEGIIGREVIQRTYELVMTEEYQPSQVDDVKARESQDILIQAGEKVRRLVNSTNFGIFNGARIIKNIEEQAVEFDEANKIVITRISLDVQFKLARN